MLLPKSVNKLWRFRSLQYRNYSSLFAHGVGDEMDGKVGGGDRCFQKHANFGNENEVSISNYETKSSSFNRDPAFLEFNTHRTLNRHYSSQNYTGYIKDKLLGSMPKFVKIVEVGSRDVLQNEKDIAPTSVKVELIKMLVSSGLPVVEATSFVSPKWVPQLADAKDVMSAIQGFGHSRFPVLTPTLKKLGSSVKALTELKELFSLAEKYGYSEWIQFDASIVRGLAYYTGIVFEGFDRERKLRAICGGGRYDRLLSTFGGEDVPACGFGFGDAVIIELLKERGLLPELSPQVQNIVCSLGQDLQGAACLVAARLREKGQTVDLVLENKPLKWVFKRATRVNAQRLVIVGSSEWEKGMVGVKILSSGEQYEIKIDELE